MPRPMSAPGTPLKPVPPLLRWSARGLGWAAAIGLVASRAGDGNAGWVLASGLLGGFTWILALETHQWLPTQNTVAAAVQVSIIGSLILATRGRLSASTVAIHLLIWFSHLLAARGLIRYLLRPWRRASGYGVGVLVGTTLLTGVLVGLSQACIGLGPSMGEWLFQTVGLGLAVLAASIWLLVKKPVPESANPRPAVLGVALTAIQALTLALVDRAGVGILAGIGAIAATMGLVLVHRSLVVAAAITPPSADGTD